ncbi:MAG: hypothetical protein A3I05_04450 [Deltaproteobacteria bacterium RIFCSPLOWO2_02_FULL_44_10]|nr:MAG: hypothetical protein A3C46_07255 [Deltaproteobacteria bacterium RIFCSPHIGHO2_02_FULL_44_16]OGQ46608.1 MAG: hypothetical protein A3I05_04450 [Deltaproteobacteria bacterium RIFCSPLOWO2_02_FULL_44_10]
MTLLEYIGRKIFLMARIRICKEDDCKNAATTSGYCRLHYLKNWKTIREEKQTKAADRLNKYVEGICKRNPDGYVEEIRKGIQHGDFDEFEDAFTSNNPLRSFSEVEYEEEVKGLLKELRIEKEFKP